MQTPVPWVGQDGCRERCMGKEYQQLGSPGRLKLRGSGHTAWKGDTALRQKMYIWSFGWWTEPGTRLPREAMESPSWIVLLLLALAVCRSRLTHSTAAWGTDRPHHGTTAYFPLFPSSESFSSPEFISWNKVAYNIFHSQAFNLVMLSSSMKAVGRIVFLKESPLELRMTCLHACEMLCSVPLFAAASLVVILCPRGFSWWLPRGSLGHTQHWLPWSSPRGWSENDFAAWEMDSCLPERPFQHPGCILCVNRQVRKCKGFFTPSLLWISFN